MCGPTSAIGLSDAERELWPLVRDRLRQPGALMGLMRGVLGDAAEVGAVVATTPAGVSRALAVLVTPAIADELDLSLPEEDVGGPRGAGGPVVRRARVGDDEVDVLVAPGVAGGAPRPVAVLVSDWMREHLYLYARQLWYPRRRP